MSLGIFRSIRGSYVESYRKAAEKIIQALNKEFARRGIPPYFDPNPDEDTLRRLPCGNAGASTFGDLESRARQAGLPWTLGTVRGERQIALPIPFAGKFSLPVGRTLLVFVETQEFCAVRTVYDELLALAPLLQIPLVNGAVTEETADRLADCELLPGDEEETAAALENERGLWLDLYFATRYSLEDHTPVVIA
ncbi:MAG TPA: hypothetical protein VK961_17235 [Chthoniobacter sp.]|nr:hypothetical protein [Chthoniobacter sp.]